ncbi:efflux RND transporter periplasmic adaptor subunit [Brasilonema bromeliae]|uniref:Efflux RND transporter periplasmic adaptor subunit n=1 Tax=Brasilonema bromeliae SPC951 TaxID=385972 RepID=A0ABX1P5C0_9CYAN|nr:efflux RND transporter periplasmic adaptor subunit [Brasilonema bromeliae]NMG18931.1 efflux RND transporter periplasmic adaptor subunit [Brasilonema bromeliae SPC951]
MSIYKIDIVNAEISPSTINLNQLEALVLDNIPKESLAQKNSAQNHLEFKQNPPSKKRTGLVLLGLVLLATLGFLGYRTFFAKPNKTETSQRSERSGRKGRSMITPVTVAKVGQKTVPVQLQAIGNVQAQSTVSVTPQIGGRITGVFFKKGQEVKKGQLLFTLDDQTQRAAIQQAQGTVAKDLALVEQARATLAKDQGLVEQARATLAKDQGLVRQAEATLAKDQAQAQYAQAQSNRYTNLYKQGAVSQDQAQQYSTSSQVNVATLQSDREAIANAQEVVKGDQVAIQNAQQVVKSDQVAIKNAQEVVKGDQAAIQNAQAVVASDQGALKNAQVQLSYAKIYAPISGQAGDILVTQGNVVAANSTSPLLTISQIRPIQVSFSVPETQLPEIQKYASNNKLAVDVTIPNTNRQIRGVLTFINNTVDNSTGTIKLIGQFDNAQGQLWPGQYVNTTLTLRTQPNATVVPSQAVQNGPNGQFVFVVKPDNTVENVPVTVGSMINGLNVIEKGLQPGQTVVTDGQANLISGSKVRVKPASKSAGGAS